MSKEEKDFPVDYQNIVVTLEKPIIDPDAEGSKSVEVFRCVEIGVRNDVYQFFQPGIANRNNDVLEVRKDNVRGILYKGDTDE